MLFKKLKNYLSSNNKDIISWIAIIIGILTLYVAIRACNYARLASLQPRMKIRCYKTTMSEEESDYLTSRGYKCHGVIKLDDILKHEVPTIVVKNDGEITAQEVIITVKLDEPFMIAYTKSTIQEADRPDFNDVYKTAKLRFSDLEVKDSVLVFLWYCYKKIHKGRETKGTLIATVECPEQKRGELREREASISLEY